MSLVSLISAVSEKPLSPLHPSLARILREITDFNDCECRERNRFSLTALTLVIKGRGCFRTCFRIGARPAPESRYATHP